MVRNISISSWFDAFKESAVELAMETSRVTSAVRNQLEHDNPAETITTAEELKWRSEPAGLCIEKLAEEEEEDSSYNRYSRSWMLSEMMKISWSWSWNEENQQMMKISWSAKI
ncbi:hypothetical protein F511_10624 [Dorcoceras hygrometricum]|uniref:Uncharacterized protein n=1 Tax=Dorcoceras hygrometricum TaxID=472368 RepID=A0A2Z7CP70_9LAMI|nr:hypothetical protein F511_10624 [Dorcoceras hygrometricum]